MRKTGEPRDRVLDAGDRRRIATGLALMIAAVTMILYGPALGADFVYDSRAQIVTDSYLYDPGHLGEVLSLRVLSRDVVDRVRPANVASLMIDALVWGRNPVGFHLTNVTLHALNAVLLFFLLIRLAPPTRVQLAVCVVAALAFAVHPVNSEAVCEVSYREDLLATGFLLAGLLAAARIVPEHRRQALGFAALCTASLFIAATAKETGWAGPALLALFLHFFRRDWPRRWRVGLPLAALAGVGLFLAARFACAPDSSAIFGGPAPTRLGGSWMETLRLQTRIGAFYLSRLFWPAHLCADYGPYSIRTLPFKWALGLLAAAGTGLALGARRRPMVQFGIALTLASLAPVSNIVPLFRPMADRFLYLPLAGLAMIAAGLADRIAPRRRRWALVVSVIALAGLAGVTWNREKVWHDSLALWTDTAQRNPGSSAAANNLGFALHAVGRDEAAVASWNQAIRLTRGRSADPWAGLALGLDAIGARAEARTALARAIELDPRYADPDRLVQALIWEPDVAEELRCLIARNAPPPERTPPKSLIPNADRPK